MDHWTGGVLESKSPTMIHTPENVIFGGAGQI